VDFFSDLMSVLHSLAETGGLTNKECMLCVLTAFEILSGQGESLTIDSRQFYVQLYGALLQLDTGIYSMVSTLPFSKILERVCVCLVSCAVNSVCCLTLHAFSFSQ
jgi:hypothetical protein